MTSPRIGTREEWQVAREELLRREKEHTRMADQLARERRELPCVGVEKEYEFETEEGPRTLADLFDGRSQLLVYHFMFGPSYEAGCPVCSSSADAVNGVLFHLNARDVTMLYVSRAPLERLQAYKRRMGWAFPWVSSAESDFNFDFGVSYTDAQLREHMGPILEGEPPHVLRQMAAATGTDVPGYISEGPGGERVRPGRRRRLPHLFHARPRTRVPDELLPHPRPDAEGTRRGRFVRVLGPTARCPKVTGVENR